MIDLCDYYMSGLQDLVVSVWLVLLITLLS